MGLTSCANREAQVEVTITTVQGGCHAIAEAVVEKRTKARGSGFSPWNNEGNEDLCCCTDIKEWMWGVEEDTP